MNFGENPVGVHYDNCSKKRLWEALEQKHMLEKKSEVKLFSSKTVDFK